jgi:hypothetical protein
MGNFDKALDEDFQNQPLMPAILPERTITVLDLGPRLPADVPKEPAVTATPGQWLDYEEDVSSYVALVLKFRRERSLWTEKHGTGPVKIALDPVSAREMVERGAGRYVLPSGLKQ